MNLYLITVPDVEPKSVSRYSVSDTVHKPVISFCRCLMHYNKMLHESEVLLKNVVASRRTKNKNKQQSRPK